MGFGSLAFWRRGRVNAAEVWTQEDVTLFLQSGGRFSPKDFLKLDPESRQAVATVGRAFLADLIAAFAQAIHDPDYASRLGAQGDGGERRETDVMAAALAAVGEKIQRGRR